MQSLIMNNAVSPTRTHRVHMNIRLSPLLHIGPTRQDFVLYLIFFLLSSIPPKVSCAHRIELLYHCSHLLFSSLSSFFIISPHMGIIFLIIRPTLVQSQSSSLFSLTSLSSRSYPVSILPYLFLLPSSHCLDPPHADFFFFCLRLYSPPTFLFLFFLHRQAFFGPSIVIMTLAFSLLFFLSR